MFIRRALPCSPLPTLPGAARPCSRRFPARRAVFVFRQNNCSDFGCLLVRIDTYQSERQYVNRVVNQVDTFPCEFRIGVSYPVRTFFFVCRFFKNLLFGTVRGFTIE